MAEVLLFAGALTRIDDAGQWTGIFKKRVDGPVHFRFDGLAGDLQADRRVHGGPEKAVHQFAVANYRRLAEQFPEIAGRFVAGSIGENISADGFDEDTVCVGDVFRLGSVRLQISQPRSPCWKIDHAYTHGGLAQAIARTGRTGWYYRVLEEGTASAGDELILLDRLPNAVTLADLWSVWQRHRPELASLHRLSEAPGLASLWRKRLYDRWLWLRKQAGSETGDPGAAGGASDAPET